MSVGREQWVPGSGRLYLSGNLGHAAQNLIVRSKRHRVERKGFPAKGKTGCGMGCTEGSPEVNRCTAD